MRPQLNHSRILLFTFLLAALYGLIAVSIPYILTTDTAENMLVERLAEVLEAQTGLTLELGDIHASGFGQVRIDEIRLREADEVIVSAEAALIRVDIGRLLLVPWQPVQSLSAVTLVKPAVNVSHNGETWNVVSLINGTGTGSASTALPRLRVYLKDGAVTIQNWPESGQTIRLSEIDGQVSTAAQNVSWRLTSRNSLIEAGLVTVSGSVKLAQDTPWSIEVTAPEVVAASYQKSGIFSIPELVLTGGSGDVQITLRGGDDEPVQYGVEVKLREAAGEFSFLPERLAGINGRLSFDGTTLALKDVAGHVGQSRLALSGRIWDFGEPKLDLDVTDAKVQLIDLHRVLSHWDVPPFDGESRLAGEAIGQLRILGTAKEPLVTGEMNLTGGQIDIPQVVEPLEQVKGKLRFKTTGIEGNLQAAWLGGTVSVNGSVINWFDPVLDVDLTGRLPLGPVAQLEGVPSSVRDRKLTGEGTVSAHVQGPWQAPLVDGELTVSDVSVDGTEIGQITLNGTYDTRRLDIEQFGITRSAGALSGKGYAVFDETEGNSPAMTVSDYALGLKLDQFLVDAGLLEAFPQIRELMQQELIPSEGTISGSLLVRGTGIGLEDLSGSGALDVEWEKWRAVDLKHLSLGFSLTEQVVDINYLELTGRDSSVTAQGTLDLQGQIDMMADLRSINLAKLGLHPDLDGLMDFRGNVTGTIDSPEVSGKASVREPRWQTYGARNMVADITLSQGRLNFARGKLQLDEGSASFSGNVAMGPNPDFDIDLKAESVQLASILESAANLQDASGLLSGEMHLSGPLTALSGHGDFRLSEALLFGEHLDQAKLSLRLKDRRISISQMDARLLDGSIGANGTVDLDRGWDIDLKVANINLTELNWLQTQVGSQGIVDSTLRIKGDLQNPTVNGRLSARDIKVKEYSFDRVEGDIAYSDSKVRFETLNLHHGNGIYTLSGTVGVARDPELDVKAKLDRGSLDNVLSLTGLSLTEEISGELDGYAHLWGRLSDPTGRIVVSLNQGAFAGTTLEGDLDVTLHDSELRVNRMRLEPGEGLLVGKGSLVSGGKVNFFLQGTDVMVEPLSRAFGLADLKLKGALDATLTLEGTTQQPKMQGEITVTKGSLRDIAFDKAISRFDLLGARLFVRQASLEAQGHVMKADGYLDLPLPALARLGVNDVKKPENAQINLKAQLPKGSAQVLSLFAPGLLVTGGNAEGLLTATGTWDNPGITGTVKARGIELAHPGLPEPVKELQFDAVFTPGTIEISKLSGVLGGGRFTGSGKARLSGLVPVDLDLKASGNGIGYKTDLLSGKFSGDVTVNGPFEMPTLSGNIRVQKGKVQIKLPKGGEMPINAKLDLLVQTADDIAVRGFGIDLMANGALHVGGTLQEPALNGRVLAARGRLNYLGTNFNLVDGAMEFSPVRGITPYLDVRAKTRVDGVDITLLMQGSLDNLSTELRSDPQMEQRELVAMLGWPGRLNNLASSGMLDELDEEMVKLVEGQIASQFVGDLAQTFQSALDLDTLQITPSFLSQSVKIELGKYLVDDLYITYSRTLQEEGQQELGLEYRLSPNLVLESSLDGDGEHQVGLKGKFRF